MENRSFRCVEGGRVTMGSMLSIKTCDFWKLFICWRESIIRVNGIELCTIGIDRISICGNR